MNRIKYEPPSWDDVKVMTNAELHSELSLMDIDENLWAEIGFRLGVSSIRGVRPAAVAGAPTFSDAERLRRFRDMWTGQPEFNPNDIDL